MKNPNDISRLAALFLFSALSFPAAARAEQYWYRGNTHTHSLWSDGNDFPESIVAWFQENGYQFVALSDHDILATSERWMSLETIRKRQRTLGRPAFEKYLRKFGEDWVETRTRGEVKEVRLKRIDEYRPLFEKPDRFLVLQGEEISNSAEGKPVHINAINLPGKNAIPSIKKGSSIREVIRANLEAVAAREASSGQPILVHLNHPNFQWGITALDLAHVKEMRFFEVYNGHPGIRHLGDEEHPGDEKIWDIVNTIRLGELGAAPLLGVATDDSHNYHGGPVSPGRGWVMVRAERLEGNALVEAMRKGEFYASSGVTLAEFSYDPGKRSLSFAIVPQEGVTYHTQLIGTRRGVRVEEISDLKGVGEVLAEFSGETVTCEVPRDILFARALVTSSRKHPNPSFEGQREQAWLQPVGWEGSEAVGGNASFVAEP